MTETIKYPAPIEAPPVQVKPEWIDYNGHLNVAYYVLVFDQSLDRIFDAIGLGAEDVERTGGSSFILQNHVSYLQEVREGDPLRVTFHLLDYDSKRFHYFMEMYHAKEGYLAATSEQISIYVDLGTRKAAPMPDRLLANLRAMLGAHRKLPRPDRVGAPIRIKHKAAD